MDLLIENFFNIKIMSEAFPFLVRGLKTTLLLCVIVIPLGLIGGLLVALLTNIKIKIIYYTLIFVIDFFRAVNNSSDNLAFERIINVPKRGS